MKRAGRHAWSDTVGSALLCAALALCLLLLGGLIGLLATKGLAHFASRPLVELELASGETVLGELVAREGSRLRVRLGRRDLVGADFRWIELGDVRRQSRPDDALLLEHRTWGRIYGRRASRTQREALVVRMADGSEVSVDAADIVRAVRPNALGVLAGTQLYLERVVEFLLEGPRQSNLAGGIFPALFGTVLLVLLTSLAVTPLGVLTAIYLHEYARGGIATRAVRIAVNSLAGVPSIVVGVFGLGFFVYGVGGSIDQLFFTDRLPAPTFGTGGILWASLTLALLTVPVVVVATEEGLSAVPRSVREGSLALGATRLETLRRVVLPGALPGILTGLILAMARAAGEVAPLMIVGAVKLAPTLPIDAQPPWIHLERKFMHLGFHIYDAGFQSPDVEAARSLVFATALLLVAVVLVTNLAAILLRNRLRKKYAPATS